MSARRDEGLSIRAAAERFGRAPALVAEGETLTFEALRDRVDAVLERLESPVSAARAEVGRAEPLVLGLTVDAVVAILLRLEARRTLGLLHPRLTAAERAPLLEVLRATPLGEAPPAAIFFTSGTTGRPKGAMLSVRALVASARAAAAALALAPGDRWLLAMPLAHVGGFSILTRALVSGFSVVLPRAAERFDAEAIITAIARDEVTLVSLVPTMLHRLLARTPRWDPPPSVRAMILGGAHAPAPLLARAAERGWPVVTTYGLTETASMVTLSPLGTPIDASLGAGRPLPGVALRLRPVDAHAGVIEVRGPSLMDGYLGLDGAFTADGWFSTGDLGRFDAAGNLHVLARRTDLVVTGGENVYPAEVEDLLLRCPGVAAACVFGLPDEEWGERVAAALVPSGREDTHGLSARVAAFAAERLAPHKRPRTIVLLEALPTGGSGKVDRGETRRLVAAQLAREPETRA